MILFDATNKQEKDSTAKFCYSDYAANSDTRQSQTGYIFSLFGSAFYWKSCLKNGVTLSTTKAEYIALTLFVKENMWFKGLAADSDVSCVPSCNHIVL